MSTLTDLHLRTIHVWPVTTLVDGAICGVMSTRLVYVQEWQRSLHIRLFCFEERKVNKILRLTPPALMPRRLVAIPLHEYGKLETR
jgi:hypothetical protein